MFKLLSKTLIIFTFCCSLISQANEDKKSSQSYTDNWLFNSLAAGFANNAGDGKTAVEKSELIALESKQYKAFEFAFDLAWQNQYYSQAEKIARTWLDFYESDQEALLALLKVLFAEDRFAEIIPYAERLLQTDNSPNNIVQLSRMSSEFKNRGDKILLFQELVKRFPKNSYLHYYLALIAKEQGRIDIALQSFSNAKKLDAHWRQLEIMQAEALSGVGELKSALQILENLKKRYPNDPEIISAQIDLLADNYHWSEALKLAKKWQKMQKDSPHILQLTAWLHQQNGDLVQAQALYSQLLAQEYIDLDTFLFNVAQAGKNKNPEFAQSLLQQIQQNSPFFILAQQESAFLAFKNGNIEDAKKIFSNLRNLFPEQSLDFYILELNQLSEVDKHSFLQEISALFPENIYLKIAKIDYAEDKEKEFQILLDNYPDNAEIMHGYANFLLENDRFDDAREYIEKIITDFPDIPEFQSSYAQLLLHDNLLEEALAWQRRAYSTYRSEKIVINYVNILIAKKNYNLAREIVQLALIQQETEQLLKLKKELEKY